MKYTLTKPCAECPFLKSMKHGFKIKRLREFASGEFACHKTCEIDEEGDFNAREGSPHCAGALIFLEKRGESHQMMRIVGRLGMYDPTALDMTADVR